MSQAVIFSIGAVVFALTVWGSVMAGGVWFGQLAESQDGRPLQKPPRDEVDPDEDRDAPHPS